LHNIDIKYRDSVLKYTLEIPNLSTEMVYMPRDVILGYPSVEVKLKDAAGHISSEVISPYPPGIPILIPGERITEEIVEYLYKLRKKKKSIDGEYHGMDKIDKIRIVKTQ